MLNKDRVAPDKTVFLDGLPTTTIQGHCRRCEVMTWRSDPETRRIYRKNYYIIHKDEILQKGKLYYLNNKDYVKNRVAAYKEAHPSERKTISKNYYNNLRISNACCLQCGTSFKAHIDSCGLFCSLGCSKKWHRQEHHPGWKGGISSWPYCPKFTTELKEEIRDKFNRMCFLSGTKESGRKLSVHHCDYLKSQGCQGQRWSLLPLVASWHMKTNYNRWYWFALLRDYWCYKYLTFHGMDVFEGPSRTEWLWKIYDEEGY